MGLLIFLFLFSASALSYQIQILGAQAFRSEAIKKRIEAKLEQNQKEERQLEQLRFQILGMYRKAGFINAKLEWLRPNEKQIICKITEGNQVLIRDIQVVGAQHFSNELLRKKIFEFARSEPMDKQILSYDNPEINSILNPGRRNRNKKEFVFFERGFLPFNKSLFLSAKEFLEEFYLDNGFLEIRVFGPKESEITQDHWIGLQFRIEEGLQTRVAEIQWSGAPRPDIKNPAIQVGDPLNLYLVEDLRTQAEES